MRPLLAAVALLALAACAGGNGGAARPATSTAGTPSSTTGVEHEAWVGVAVANLWAQPGTTRALDAPSLSQPVDMHGWLSSMTVDDRLWLVGRLVTQALYGDRVLVVDTAGDWAKVVVPRQPTSLDPRGYPGWLPAAQLSSKPPPAGTSGDAVVARPAATLHDAGPTGHELIELSYGTRLPLLAAGPESVTVGTPGGGQAWLAPTDVAVTPPRSPTGEQLVESAGQFAGVAYLWGGTSARGWDCSGLTWAVYAAHGVTIPRDADDQSAAGTAVDRDDLQPGDLLFYATGGDRTAVTHVGMYAGDGRMIQAPATGRTVETVPVDSPGLAARYRGARRYLPPAGQ